MGEDALLGEALFDIDELEPNATRLIQLELGTLVKRSASKRSKAPAPNGKLSIRYTLQTFAHWPRQRVLAGRRSSQSWSSGSFRRVLDSSPPSGLVSCGQASSDQDEGDDTVFTTLMPTVQ